MQKLLAGIVLLGLGLLVAIATIVHYATRMDPQRTAPQPALETAPDPELPDGKSVVVRIGEGRATDAPQETQPAPLAPTPRQPDTLTVGERQKVDERGYLSYTVQSGDTLYKLSSRYLGNGALSAQILRHNPELQRPQDLRAGMTLRIPLWLKQNPPR